MTTSQIAQGLAGLGRHGDSMLMHVTPHEVAGLQAIAQANGTSLTINPSTGMPEAFSLGGFFKSLLPTIAGFGVGMIPGMQPIGYGIAAGALTGAALNKKDPLMGAITGGLGGYGGANLAGKMGSFGTQAAQAGTESSIAAITDPNAQAMMATQNAQLGQGAGAMDAFSNPGAMFGNAPSGAYSNALSNVGPTQPAVVGGGGLNVGQASLDASSSIPQSPQTFGGNLQQAYSNVASNPMDFLKQNAMAVGMPLGAAGLAGIEGPPPGMTQEEYEAEQRRKFNQPLNLNADTGLRLAGGGMVAFDDGGSVGSSGSLNLRREEEQMAPMQAQMMPQQAMAVPAQTELGIAALKPGQENDVNISINSAQAGQQMQPLADRAPSEGIPALMQDLGGQGVNFEKLYGRAQAPAPMGPRGPMQFSGGFGPDGKRLAAGGSIQQGGTMDLYQGTDSQAIFGGTGNFGLGRLNNLAQQQSMANAETGRFAKGGAPRLEDGGFVVPADVTFYMGGHSTEAGQRKLAKMYGGQPIKGPGTGLSDSIPTSIEGREPARVADGEVYIPRKSVMAHGGPEKFYKMMDKVRKKATGTTKQAKSA